MLSGFLATIVPHSWIDQTHGHAGRVTRGAVRRFVNATGLAAAAAAPAAWRWAALPGDADRAHVPEAAADAADLPVVFPVRPWFPALPGGDWRIPARTHVRANGFGSAATDDSRFNHHSQPIECW